MRRGMRHGTDWAYRKCTSGPGGSRCEACLTAHRNQVAGTRARARREAPPADPHIASLRRAVACVGCGAIRVPVVTRSGQPRTRIDHTPGCQVAGIREASSEGAA